MKAPSKEIYSKSTQGI